MTSPALGTRRGAVSLSTVSPLALIPSLAASRAAAERVAERAQGLVQSLRAALARCRQRVEPLGDRTLGAFGVDALESANLDRDGDALAEARPIIEPASVRPMHSGAATRAARTSRRSNRTARVHPEAIIAFVPPADVLANGLERPRQARNDGHRNLVC